MISYSIKQRPGAGFVVVRKFNEKWKILGLKINGKYDIPKGGAEAKDKGDLFLTAQRECFEECGILISPKNLKWGNSRIQIGPLTLFVAETSQDPIIRKNSSTGIFEHEKAEWLDWNLDDIEFFGYLKPGIAWARQIVES